MKEKTLSRYIVSCLLFCLMIIYQGEYIKAEDEQKNMTIMLYICGSNLESENGSASRDINEIIKSRYDRDRINVIAMAGGSTKWWGNFKKEETAIYDLSGRRPEKVYVDGFQCMGEKETLSNLLQFGYENYPAEEYALIIWDHGGGPLDGICWDMMHERDNLTLQELKEALENSPAEKYPLEWIGFDACLMASAETAYIVAPFAKYMIASEETEPASGWDYHFLESIQEECDGKSIGRDIIDYYVRSLSEENRDITLSCLDLSCVENLIKTMNIFFANIYKGIDELTFVDLSSMVQETKSFGRSDNADYNSDLVDLMDLVQHYKERTPEEANQLISTLDNMIVYNYGSQENMTGISVYHPYYNKNKYTTLWRTNYDDLGFSKAYRFYLKRFASHWLGEKLTDWDDMVTEELLMEDEVSSASGEDEDIVTYGVQLTDEQSLFMTSAQMVILEEQDDTFTPVYVTDEVTLNDDGILSADYQMESLYVVNSEGDHLAGPISYQIRDGEYIVPGVFLSFADASMINVQYHCSFLEEENGLEVNSIWVYDPVSSTYTPRMDYSGIEYDCIYFPKYYKEMTYEEAISGIQDWTIADYSMQESVMMKEEWKFSFEKVDTEGNLYVTFQVTDSQVNTVSSEPVMIEDRGDGEEW